MADGCDRQPGHALGEAAVVLRQLGAIPKGALP
jgi:hypothetical protein